MLEPYFTEAVIKAEPSWRKVVALAVEHGVAVPAFSSSLSYYDGLRRSRAYSLSPTARSASACRVASASSEKPAMASLNSRK